ncbi:uncharacterized protein F5891DRAFT_1053697, partial [Suillus fuscotomentosus]
FKLVFIFVKLQDVDKAIFSEANLVVSPRLIGVDSVTVSICKVVKMALDYVNRHIHLSFDVAALGPTAAPNADTRCLMQIVYPVPLGLEITKTSVCCKNVHDG